MLEVDIRRNDGKTKGHDPCKIASRLLNSGRVFGVVESQCLKGRAHAMGKVEA